MLARAQADATHHVEKTWFSRTTGLISNGPDTSATLYGPVHIGKTGSGIEAAPPPGVAPATATIQASPVSDKNLAPPKPAEEKTPANDDSAKAKVDTNGKDQSATPTPASPVKKKGRFHIFKKVIPPL